LALVEVIVAPIGKKRFRRPAPRQVARGATLAEGNAFRYDLNYDVLRSV